jgi:putative chitinase
MYSDILAKLAPRTPKSKRERFVPFLERYCPVYDIDSKDRVAAFLSTTGYESMYFQATKEGRAKTGTRARRFQDAYWHTGYFGRGLIQTTHKKNYEKLQLHLDKKFPGNKWDVVANPELLEQPELAVISACYFWEWNGFNRYADRGEFYEIQDITNTGRLGDDKKPLHYDDREALYKIALRAVPDDFPGAIKATATEPSDAEPPSVAQSVEDKSNPAPGTFFNSTMDRLAGIKTKFDAIGVDPATISKPSWIKIALQYILAAFFGAYAFLKDNPLVLIGVVAFIGFAVYLYSRSKDRADKRANGG